MLCKACFRPYLHVFHPIWVLVGGGGGGSQGNGTQPAYAAFPPWTTPKWKFSKLVFFDIVTTQYDHPSYLKQILGRIWVFFTLFGCWGGGGGGGAPKGMVHSLLMQFFTLDSSKMEVFKICFLDVVTT